MASLKYLLIAVILSSIVMSQFVETAPATKKQRQHIKSKKSNNNAKLKAAFKNASTKSVQQRNAKMNLMNSRSWPSTNSFYTAPSTAFYSYLRSPSSSSMYYPSMRWSSPYLSSSTPMSNFLRRSDDFSSMPSMSTNSPITSMMSIGGSQTPTTIVDMSAFGGNGMMENAYSTQNMWSMPETSGTKPKLNLFNSFSLNDDGLIGALFNHFN